MSTVTDIEAAIANLTVKEAEEIHAWLEAWLENRETALLSERALARGWNRPEEDAAWSYLQQGQ
jgi:hypothetical protein